MKFVQAGHRLSSNAAAVAFAISLTLFAGPGKADDWSVTNYASPEGNQDQVSAQASFSVTGQHTLQVVLTNYTGDTLQAGDVLTGITWDFKSGAPTLTLSSIGLTSGSKTYPSTSTTGNTTMLMGNGKTSWTNNLFTTTYGSYGVATTGFNGLFNGGSIKIGNASPDYGIVGATTFPYGTFGGKQFPVIEDSLTFTFTTTSDLSQSAIADATFLFGTNGSGHAAGNHSAFGSAAVTPEGSSLAMITGGLLPIFGGMVWLRRKKVVA